MIILVFFCEEFKIFQQNPECQLKSILPTFSGF